VLSVEHTEEGIVVHVRLPQALAARVADFHIENET
jgi:hypothetical protein